MNPLHDDVFAITIVLMGFFRFATISSLLREPILHIMMIKTADRCIFKMATGCSKWLPAVFLNGFLALQAPKMAAPMEDGELFSPLECIKWFVSVGFFISLYNVFYTAISLERINVVKQGTTVNFTWEKYPKLNF